MGRNKSGEQRRYQRQCIRLPAKYVGHINRIARELGLIMQRQTFTRDTFWISGEPDKIMKFRQKIDEVYLCGLPHEGRLNEVYRK